MKNNHISIKHIKSIWEKAKERRLSNLKQNKPLGSAELNDASKQVEIEKSNSFGSTEPKQSETEMRFK